MERRGHARHPASGERPGTKGRAPDPGVYIGAPGARSKRARVHENGALSWEDLIRLDKPSINPAQGRVQRDQACCLKGCLAERVSERGG